MARLQYPAGFEWYHACVRGVLYLNYATLVTWLTRLVKPLPKAEQMFDAVLAYLATLASWQTQMLQQNAQAVICCYFCRFSLNTDLSAATFTSHFQRLAV